MKMKIDYEKAKQLLEEKPNLTEEEYNKRFWDLWEKLYENSHLLDSKEDRELKTKVNKRIQELERWKQK